MGQWETKMKLPIWAWVVPAAMSLIALLPMPYAFYMLVRIVVCAAAIFIAWRQYKLRGIDAWCFAFGCIAILFNPIFPINLSREMWAPLDVGVAALFGVYAYRSARRS